ncbi:hypothetical protein E2K80_03365 [Rhodophyticola sp. CCM32]|uniref:SMP-30/gluconolactonase/LRE family protein n=1 Tax=Rhodophyticola sp. CCM32 TaxID=2916397 RepID=UPI00107F6170|nr:SMP-30/gluconolactonase/LRE family protein [Rhodophyticola sp. CCM32]QBX99890.1 hypothetical protein E2K80_03365 [Rhodophyticola sp. CCM32]
MTDLPPKARSATLSKGLEILSFLGSQGDPVSLRTVMAGLGMTKPTAHRLLATLVDHGMVRFDSGANTYCLGMRIFELSRQVWRDLDLRSAAMGEMQKLHTETGETILLAILTPDGGVYIDELQSRHHLREQPRVGQRVPLWRSAIGKALISGLGYSERTRLLNDDAAAIRQSPVYRDVRELTWQLDLVNARGYAIEIEEDMPGISGVAAPIVDHRGITVAAIGLSGATSRLDRDALHRLGPSVIEATRLASLQAGGVPRPVSTARRPADLPTRVFNLISQADNLIGEGPVISRDRRYLYWVDICRPCVFRHDLTSGQTSKFRQKDMVTAIADTGEGLLLASLSGIRVMDIETGQTLKDLGHPEADIPTNRFNDGKLDSHGRFWIGSLAFNLSAGAGALYRVDPDGTHCRMETGLTLPNGLGWAPDTRTMYLIDTSDRVLFAYDFDAATGRIANRRDLIRFARDVPGNPDGLEVDPDGNLLVAMWDGWCIRKYSPDGGFLEAIPVPFPRPTSCVFLPAPQPRLLVTSARIRIATDLLEHCPHAGSVVEIPMG